MTERPQSPARYHSVAIVLHWLLAGLLVYQFALGLRLDELKGGDKFVAFQLHKSIGITVLLLSLARLTLRLFVARPAEFGEGAQKLAARLVHWGFYAVMLLGPLTGWIIVSTAKIKLPTMLFGVVPWPHLPLPAAFNQPAELAHAVLVWSLPALVALHIAAVLYHLRKRDEVPGRMFAASLAGGIGVVGGAALLALSVGLGMAGPLPDLWSRPGAVAASIDTGPTPVIGTSESVALPELTEAVTGASDQPDAEKAKFRCDWLIDPGTRIGFIARYGGEPINGAFRRSSAANIKFCADDLPHAAIDWKIDLASVDTGDAERDESLRGASFFNAPEFAQAHYTATGFKLLAPGRYAANGTLSLHGIKRPVRLVFTLVQSGRSATAHGSADLSRLAFGVGSDEWAATDQIPDAVAVQFTIRATRAN